MSFSLFDPSQSSEGSPVTDPSGDGKKGVSSPRAVYGEWEAPAEHSMLVEGAWPASFGSRASAVLSDVGGRPVLRGSQDSDKGVGAESTGEQSQADMVRVTLQLEHCVSAVRTDPPQGEALDGGFEHRSEMVETDVLAASWVG